MTYAFNVTFTRPDENNLNVYTVGYNVVLATNRHDAFKWLLLAFDHVNVTNVFLFAILDEEGNRIDTQRGV